MKYNVCQVASCGLAFPRANSFNGHMLKLRFPSAAASAGLIQLQRRSRCVQGTFTQTRPGDALRGDSWLHLFRGVTTWTRPSPPPPTVPHITRSTPTLD